MTDNLGENTEKKFNVSMGDITNTVQKLSELIEQETFLLKTMKMNELPMLQEEKLTLIHILEITKKLLKTKPDLFANASTTDKEALRAAHAKLDSLMAENYTELTKAVAINQKVIEFISDAAKEQIQQQAGYSDSGTFSYTPKYHSVITPLTVNDEV